MSRDRFHNPYTQSIINTTPSFSSWIFLVIIRWPPHFTNGSSRDMTCIIWHIIWHIIWPLSHDSDMSRDLFPPNGNRINISCGRKMIKLNYSEWNLFLQNINTRDSLRMTHTVWLIRYESYVMSLVMWFISRDFDGVTKSIIVWHQGKSKSKNDQARSNSSFCHRSRCHRN